MWWKCSIFAKIERNIQIESQRLKRRKLSKLFQTHEYYEEKGETETGGACIIAFVDGRLCRSPS